MEQTSVNQLLCSIDDAARTLGFGRSFTYELADRGEIRTIKEGRARRVVVASLREYVERKQAEAAA